MSLRASTASRSAVASAKPSLSAAARARAASRPTTTAGTTWNGRSKKRLTCRYALPCARPMKAWPTMATLRTGFFWLLPTFLVEAMVMAARTIAAPARRVLADQRSAGLQIDRGGAARVDVGLALRRAADGPVAGRQAVRAEAAVAVGPHLRDEVDARFPPPQLHALEQVGRVDDQAVPRQRPAA